MPTTDETELLSQHIEDLRIIEKFLIQGNNFLNNTILILFRYFGIVTNSGLYHHRTQNPEFQSSQTMNRLALTQNQPDIRK